MTEETIIMRIDEEDSITADLSRSYTATSLTDGFLSKEDKTKLDGIQAGAEVNKINKITVLDDEVEPDSDGCVDLPVPVIKFFE